MAQKILKYGIGIFMPEYPEGFDPSVFFAPAQITVTVPEGDKAENLTPVRKTVTAPAGQKAENLTPVRKVVTVPAGQKAENLTPVRKVVTVPAGEDAGLIVMEAPAGRASLKIVMGAGSRARFVEMARSARELRVELEIGEGAHAEYLSVAGESVFESVRREAHLAKAARLSWIDACTSPAFSRTAFVTCLEGEGAEVSSISLLVGSGRQRYDAWHEIRHLAPRTVSDLKVRTLLSGDAKAIVRGLVRVEEDAPGCTGFQREETLLLSEYAEIDAVPNLEIENQDVRCGHAASIGRLDEEKLFYLMSRGLDRKAAERILIDAFVEPFLSAVTDDALRASLAETISAKIKLI